MADQRIANTREVTLYTEAGSAIGASVASPLYARPGGQVNAGNSSDVALGSGNVFTGAWVDVTDVANVVINAFANQASATNGLLVQWSTDGGTTVTDTDTYTISASSGETIKFGPNASHMRVVYTNGAVAQTTFRLQTVFKYGHTRPSTHRISDSLSSQQDAEVTKSIMAALRNDGAFDTVRSTNGNNLKVAIEESNFPLPATPTLTNVSASASSVTLLSANTASKQRVMFNDSASTCFVKFGTTASSTSFTYRLLPYATLETTYAGRIDGIWLAATGSMRVTEVTA